MQLEPQFVSIQLREYRSNKFVPATCNQLRVYNVSVADLLALIRTTVANAAEPVTPPILAVQVSQPTPAASLTTRDPLTGRRKLSPEARKRISDTQKLRWATRPRTISAEAKKKIGDTQRIRWATTRRDKPKTWSEIQTQPVIDDSMFVGSN